MSNVLSAKNALQAELTHAKQGLAFYQSRVESLEAAIAQIAGLDSELAAEGRKGKVKGNGAGATKRGLRGEVAQPAKLVKRAGKAAGRVAKAQGAKTKNELPSTKGDYWLNLVTDQPQTAAEIGNAAVAKLTFTPTPEQVKVLKQRATPSLHALLKADKIADQGAGRDRRFVRK